MPNSRKVLIAGGGGFLGRALARELMTQGHTVVRLDSRPMQPISAEDRTIVGNIADRALMKPLLQDCDTLIHLASATTPSISATDPLIEAKANITPTLHLLEFAQKGSFSHLIFASSGGTVYGEPSELPATESLQMAPHSYHAAGKIALESFFNAFQHLTGKTVSILRPSNLYGPEQPLKSGFGLVRTTLEHLRTGQPMHVWGSGENIRDYLYISDIVAAFNILIERGCDNGTFNVGSGVGTSVKQLIATIEQITGRSVPVQRLPPRPVDVRAIVLDNNKLVRATGWHPRIGLEEGIRRTWEWLNAS